MTIFAFIYLGLLTAICVQAHQNNWSDELEQ